MTLNDYEYLRFSNASCQYRDNIKKDIWTLPVFQINFDCSLAHEFIAYVTTNERFARPNYIDLEDKIIAPFRSDASTATDLLCLNTNLTKHVGGYGQKHCNLTILQYYNRSLWTIWWNILENLATYGWCKSIVSRSNTICIPYFALGTRSNSRS